MSATNPNGLPNTAPPFSLPTLQELENQQAEEDAEPLEIFWEPKRRKLTENETEAQESANMSAPNSMPPPALQPTPTAATAPNSGSILRFRSNSTGARQSNTTDKPKYEPGRVATGSAVDPSYLLISTKQQGNPILKHLRQVKWQFTSDIEPDYQFGAHQCGLFLSMKYHQSHGAYIRNRISSLPGHYVVRILLVLKDLEQHEEVLKQLNILAINHDMTLILAFSEMEAARYLETYKSFENTNADTLKESAAKGNHYEQVRVALSAIKPINSTDVANLLFTFGTLANIMTASMEQLATVPKLGNKKIVALYRAFHDPFISSEAQIPHSILVPAPSTPSNAGTSNIFKFRGKDPAPPRPQSAPVASSTSEPLP